MNSSNPPDDRKFDPSAPPGERLEALTPPNDAPGDEPGVPRLRPKADTFTRNVVGEALQAKHGGRKSSAGLTTALTFYGLTLAVSLVVLVWAPKDLTMLRVVDVTIVVLAAVGLAVTWRDSRSSLSVPKLTLPLALLSFLAVCGLLGICALLARFVDMSDEMIMAEYKNQGISILGALLDYALMPALGEEILFRVVILTALLEVFSERTAILVSAFMFATIHLSPFSFVHLSLIGILLAVVRLRTGSVYPCIVIHAVYNATIVLYVWYTL